MGIKYNQKIIRLRKKGCFKYPVYDIVVMYAYKRSKADFIEKLGFFNPNCKERLLFINTNRLAFWLNKGVKLTGSLKSKLYKFCY